MTDKFAKRATAQRNKYFPMQLKDGYYCDLVSEKEFYPFLKKNFRKVFKFSKGSERFEARNLTKARLENLIDIQNDFFKSHHDYIFFYNSKDEIVGWTCGESEDHISYYMRNTGILAMFQKKGIYSSFLPKFIKYLAGIGYERVTSSHLGSSPEVLIPKIREGFIISGMEAREDFGLMVKMTKLLRNDRKSVFLRKFF